MLFFAVLKVFDAISYCKGGSIVRMLSGVLGHENFRNGLGLYMKRFAYKNTASSDLWKCWEEVSGKRGVTLARLFLLAVGRFQS